MPKSNPNQYIKIQRKICNHDVIVAAHKLASDWGVTPPEACYTFLCQSLLADYKKKKELIESLSLNK